MKFDTLTDEQIVWLLQFVDGVNIDANDERLKALQDAYDKEHIE